jgi:hypothetical protein
MSNERIWIRQVNAYGRYCYLSVFDKSILKEMLKMGWELTTDPKLN